MLQVNPKMLPRLDELETDLLERRAHAEQEGWLGEIDGLDLTLNLLRQKRDETSRTVRHSTDLGMPGSRPDHTANHEAEASEKEDSSLRARIG